MRKSHLTQILWNEWGTSGEKKVGDVSQKKEIAYALFRKVNDSLTK